MAPEPKYGRETRYVTTNVEKVTPVPEERPYDPAVRSFDMGYDQAVREVLEEVQEREPTIVADLLAKYPVWAEIMARCNGQ